jgi:hypothetical protein
MAVPAPDHRCWSRLAGGALAKLKTKHLATQLMIKKLEQSHEPVSVKAAELHGFFVRWESALGAELKQLTEL